MRRAEVREDGGDPRGAGPSTGVDQDQQLHDVAVHRRPGRLDDEDVAAADILVQLDADLAVREIADLDSGQLDAEIVGDLLGQIGMSAAADDREMIVRHPCELAARLKNGPATQREEAAQSLGQLIEF
jgi:hypothetical protein